MVSEKPPRHSKSNQEPVTIDLDPKDVTRSTDTSKGEKPASQPASASADKPVTPQGPAKAAEPTKGADNVPKDRAAGAAKEGSAIGAAQWDKGSPADVSAKPQTAAAPSTPSSKPDAAGLPETKNASKPTDAKPAGTNTSAASGKPTSSPSGPPSPTAGSRNTSSSGALAAGLFGGLIALLAAGSLQYAGYIPGLVKPADTTDLDNLRSEVDSLKSSLANLPPRPTFDTSAIDQRLAALETSTAAPANIDVDGVDGLNSQLSGLQNELAALKASLSDASATNDNLTQRLDAAEEKINAPRDDIEVARAIAAAALKAAIDRGGPFLTELDTLKQVTPDDEQLALLQPFASTGVPSRAEILRGFPSEADAMLSQLNQPDPNLGVIDRLTLSARSLVRVRPVGNVAGASPEAVIARIEDKIRNGDLKGASLEWDSLPDAAKVTADGYKKSLDARIQVENLVGAAVTRALTKNADQG